ncbi:MAG: hypothetical protein IM550_20350 [Microcystis sp. M54BS1]|uniref:hypothetical protein n=1 Tax=unclassified Microcystis TaxID=2643300 RepID=UPI00257998F8|nr:MULTISPECIES: hypothetical protein [unclassified Microcystis]MCA2541479.1 hypothetical protein [Microcystis sp. M54BS1]MCA2594927.1 hypothetical protein [Microcystis sp. M38BS1]MCA2611888.1 hypothetical protein [Microcystis sp. M27BS1]MCA2505424.1 hypothetical protein [Microcystis sp. M62BS1]MCA2509211.1 hypothetical protein [Microcystis sp. M60BS1]
MNYTTQVTGKILPVGTIHELSLTSPANTLNRFRAQVKLPSHREKHIRSTSLSLPLGYQPPNFLIPNPLNQRLAVRKINPQPTPVKT